MQLSNYLTPWRPPPLLALRHSKTKTYRQDFEVTMYIGMCVEIQKKLENQQPRGLPGEYWRGRTYFITNRLSF